MPLKFATESLILLGDPSMSVVTTPVRHMLERTAKAVLRGLALDDPTASPGLAPVVGEPEKVEGRLGIAIAGRLKADQLGLGWMQGQSEPSKALWQDGEHPPRIPFIAKAQHRIIGKSDQESSPREPRLDLLLKPLIEDRVQVQVGQEGGDHATLRRSRFRSIDLPLFQDTRL